MSSPGELEAFITTNLTLAPAHAVPEIALWQASATSRLRRLAAVSGHTSPYWAYQYAGGTVLARFLLDRPATVAGRRVLDLGCGGGLVAIAAAKAGAREVQAVDIDPAAIAATRLNAAANGARVDARLADLLDEAPPEVDFVLVGDLFYAPRLAKRVVAYLERCRAAGIGVLVGDPYRAHLPLVRLRCLIEMDVSDFGGGATRSGVFEVQ